MTGSNPFAVLFFPICARIIAAEPLPFTVGFFQDNYWRDGKAEVSVFEATEKREGIVRPAEVKQIVVRESFSQSMVKTDNWESQKTYDVMKLNQIVDVRTGTYDFYQMHSGFWRVDSGRLVKFSMAVIDSCGNSYKEGRLGDNTWNYVANTYWEGMDRVTLLKKLPADVLFYDELPLKLRSLDWTRAASFSADLIPTVFGSKADSLVPVKAEFEIRETPDGKGRIVAIKTSGGTEEFVFEREYPYHLREWRRADGSALRLKSSVRIPYWKLGKPGDEQFLQP